MKLFEKKRKSSQDYYNDLGDDLFNIENEKFENDDKSLWFNLGYWKNAKTYEDANREYAELLGEFGEFERNDEILDVGFGFALQDILWMKKHQIGSIVGINISDVQLKKANELVAKEGLSDKIKLQVGDATKLDFEENSFDKVVALDCAYHFDTREDFFKESYKVLKENGTLVISDYLPLSTTKIGFIRRRVLAKVCIPSENLYGIESYEQKLRENGFEITKKEEIGRYIFQGATKCAIARKRGVKLEDVRVDIRPQDDKVYARNYRWMGFHKAYIIVAKKIKK